MMLMAADLNPADQELLFRKTTGTEIVPRGYDTRKHPKHQRHWDSRNLWCDHHGRHISPTCKLCGRVCCAYMRAMRIFKDTAQPAEERLVATRFLRELIAWKDIGKDPTTLVTCTDCHTDVCQGCASICPVFPCHDTVCIDCGSDPWRPCSWHNVI